MKDDYYSNVESVRNPHGAVIVVEPGMQTVKADTLQCVHCGEHFIPIKGSGTQRGFCRNCMGVTCGRPQCLRCLPTEKWMDMVEKKAKVG